jgi:hypothetical protein
MKYSSTIWLVVSGQVPSVVMVLLPKGYTPARIGSV